MFEIDTIKSLRFDAETDVESEWENISKALDNIKLGELRCKFSFPIEINNIIEKMPRRVFSSKSLFYDILVSPRLISFRLKDAATFESPPSEEKVVRQKIGDIISEGEANFKLFLGAFLGAMEKTTEKLKITMGVSFELPLEESPLSTIKAPVLDKLRGFLGKTAQFEEITFRGGTSDERTSFELSEDLDKQKLHVSIIRKFDSLPTSISFSKLVKALVQQSNDMLTLVRKTDV